MACPRLVELPRALADPAAAPQQRAVCQNAWNKIAGYRDACVVKDGLVRALTAGGAGAILVVEK